MMTEGLMSKKPLSLEGTMLINYVFTNASKHWNNYVRKILHSSLEIHLPNYYKHKHSVLPKQYHPYDKNLLKYLQYLVQSVKKFVVDSQKVKRLFFYWVSSRTVLQPLKTHMFMWTPLPIPGIDFRRDASVYLNLHTHFHLNMTFHHIYFSANTFDKCSLGSLSLRSTKEKSTIFLYCGIVPSFILYLSFSKIKMHINCKFFVTFTSIISHSIIDCCKIQSYPVKSKNSGVPTKSVIRFFTSESYLLQYQLQVERFQRLTIFTLISNHELIEVYDGPGILYNVLEPYVPTNEGGKLLQYTTTTFRSVISLCTENNPMSNFIHVLYEAIMSMNTQKVIYVKKKNDVQITSERELNYTEIAIIRFKTVLHYFLNITVLQMNYMGKNHSSCGFAGMTSYDIAGNETLKRLSTICHHNNNQDYKHGNTYSQESQMLLVMYSYKKYSNFSLILSVTTSQCKATRIITCELPHDPSSQESIYYFSVRKHKCLVLQVDHGQTSMLLFK